MRKTSGTVFVNVSSLRITQPFWVYSAELTAPAANTDLVVANVPSGYKGLVYGIYLTTNESCVLYLRWTSGTTTYSLRIDVPAAGVMWVTDLTALNERLEANPGSQIKLTLSTALSSTGKIQAGLLVGYA
ncbi:MAG: hypothetical protein QW230_00795 [Thermofilum sp.]